MTELKHRIIDYWLELYQSIRWPFVQRIRVINALKENNENINNALRELWKEKKIIFSKGVNDALIVYVGDQEILAEIKDLLNQ